MPELCEKALPPTTALFGGTLMPSISETRRLVRYSSRASISVWTRKKSARVRIAMMISSSAAFPARSPMPLMVPSTWRAPFRTPYSVLATAMPRSSWQCTLMVARSMFGTRSRMVRIRQPYCSGTV